MRRTLGIVAAAFAIVGLFLAGPSYSQGTQQVVHTTGSDATVTVALAENLADHEDEQDYVWEGSEVTAIVLSDSGIVIDGAGAVADGNMVAILAAGTYSVSGALADGRIFVNSQDEGPVRLVLNGVSLHCSSSAPIFIKNADKAILVLAEDANNYVADEAVRTITDSEEDDPNAAIFSKENLTICGAGSLAVNANYADGIAVKDGLIIAGGMIVVTAADDGIRGKDYLVIEDGNVAVVAASNGLKADNDSDTTAGYILIEGGTIDVTSGGDAIAAQTDVLIAGGELTLTAGGGSAKVVSSTVSTKGIKATASVVIDGGTLKIDSSDDTLHSSGSLAINGGTFVLSSGDDAIHADAAVGINGGQISIAKCYEGIESNSTITINGGNIYIVSSDDGVNIAGGVDGSGWGGGPGGMPGGGPGGAPGGGPGGTPTSTTTSYYLYINGGYLAIQAGGDGIDVCGSVVMMDGVVLVNGPTSNMDGALDYDVSFTISGGFFVAAGSSGMAEAPGTTSTQYSVLVTLQSTCPAGTLFHIQASDGTDILTFAPTKTYQTVVFSSSALQKGASYDVYYGGSSTGTILDGLYAGGAYTDGTKYTSFTISTVTTNVAGGGGGGGAVRR
ncbi:MAG: carbohydrate-binding domain-containing protein [Phycisphaerales bacterium]